MEKEIENMRTFNHIKINSDEIMLDDERNKEYVNAILSKKITLKQPKGEEQFQVIDKSTISFIVNSSEKKDYSQQLDIEKMKSESLKPLKAQKKNKMKFSSNSLTIIQTEYKPIVIYKSIFPTQALCIYGDIMVHTDINSFQDFVGINSPINMTKKINQITFYKQRKFLEISLEESNNNFIEFDSLIHLFSNYPDQGLHDFGENLLRYKKYSTRQQQMIEICRKQPGYDEFVLLKKVKYQRFKQATQYLVNENQDKNMCYFYFQRNYLTGGIELQEIKLNENLIELLGSNLEDYEELSRRIGIYCFQSKYSYNYIFNQFLQFMGECIRSSYTNDLTRNEILSVGGIQYPSQILTLDDYILDSQITIQTYLDCTDEDGRIQDDLLKFRDILHTFQLDISNSTLEMLKKNRSQLNSKPSKEILQKVSLSYELEATAFFEKFYSKKVESEELKQERELKKLAEQSKTCRYRPIRE